mmetsp:Transcript_210/g.607  ORF Transcript_210/g.607 Transcript_210/m.607 type:complete len:394 (-) Transcript_210:614-1795(-)
MGPRAASAHSEYRSEPEYPFDKRTILSRFASESECCWPFTSLVTRESLASPSGKGIYSRLTSRRRAASSSSCGRLVAPTTRTRSSRLVPAPSIWTRNSVLSLRELSWSESVRCVNRESISSIKITDGCINLATAKSARTSFSPSPTHFEVSDDADMLKNFDPDLEATALPIIVFPVPGGPNKSRPLGGPLSPLKISGLCIGQITASITHFFANLSPAISSHSTLTPESIISFIIISTNFGSTLGTSGKSSPLPSPSPLPLRAPNTARPASCSARPARPTPFFPPLRSRPSMLAAVRKPCGCSLPAPPWPSSFPWGSPGAGGAVVGGAVWLRGSGHAGRGGGRGRPLGFGACGGSSSRALCEASRARLSRGSPSGLQGDASALCGTISGLAGPA